MSDYCKHSWSPIGRTWKACHINRKDGIPVIVRGKGRGGVCAARIVTEVSGYADDWELHIEASEHGIVVDILSPYFRRSQSQDVHFSLRTIFWVNHKFVSQLSQPNFLSFLHWNNPRQSSGFEFRCVFKLVKLTYSFAAIFCGFTKNPNFHFFISKDLTNLVRIFMFTLQ